MIGKILRKIWPKQGIGKQVLFIPNTVGGGPGGSRNPRKFYNFFPNWSLEIVFPALTLTQNCYINMNISFS